MLQIDDTIAAVSTSAVPVGSAGRSIIRITGSDTFSVLEKIITTLESPAKNCIQKCFIHIEDGLDINALLYTFVQPNSYTGQDLVELHLDACPAIVEIVLQKLYQYVRPAQPGEFTQRAFLNGKIDLTQAEAVAEIVSAANTTQLAAAEQLLNGRFAHTIAKLRDEIIRLMGLLEAGLDFSEEDIEFVTQEKALEQIKHFEEVITDLLDNSIRCERIIDLDSVGLAGVPNAGKSRLLNALLGQQRSIVSNAEATTRDVLTGTLQLEKMDCVLFDCAGLLNEQQRNTLINQMSHQASLAALNKAAVVLFCVDSSKEDFESDLAMRRQITAPSVIYLATKIDSVASGTLEQNLINLHEAFDSEFIPTSSVNSDGLDALKSRIQEKLLLSRRGDHEHQDRLTINQRHEQRLTEAMTLLKESAENIDMGAAEIASMLLRQIYELLGTLESENISETVLDSIFSNFCIGK